jgi:hypothetical protein
MATRGSAGPTTRVGRTTTAAALAGLAGLAVTVAVAAITVFAPASAGRVDDHADYQDYGIRCVENGWCSTPSSR